MLRRSARLKSQQLKLEGERDPEGNMDDLPNVSEEVAQVGTAPNNDVDSGTEENDESGASSSSSLSIPSSCERALQNPVILRNLFQLCPVSIVASSRLVSKQWYDESLATWRSAFLLTLAMHKGSFIVHRDLFYHAATYVPNTFTPLKEFLEFYEKPESQCSTKPFRNFKTQACQFSLTKDFLLFWKVIGRNLTTLSLSRCKFANIEEFRQIIYQRCPVLQKLKIYYYGDGELLVQNDAGSGGGKNNELEYKDPIYGEHKHLKSLLITYGGDVEMEFPVSWMELFSHFSCLTSFELSIILAPDPELETFITAIREIRKTDKRKLPFKRFQLHPALAVSQDPASIRKIAMVKELRLPLTDCPIELHPKLDQRFLINTLDYLASSVNCIRIFVRQEDKEADQPLIPIWFPDFPFGIQMNNLTSLIIDGDLCASFAFLKYAPNLEVLDITEDELPEEVMECTSTTDAVLNTCKDELANLKMERLTTLRLEYIVSNEDMRHLINWMPNIMDLEMVLNDEQFKMVCQNWTSLTSLMVLGTELLTEAGVTGLEKGQNAMEVGIHPTISNLEVLETLVLDIKLTLESVFHLFLHLGSLQELRCDGVQNGRVNRKDLDISAYQRAIQDNVVEQWIADNGTSIMEEDAFDED